MIHLHRIALLCCFNTLWQIPLLYAAALLSDKLLRRSTALVRHRLWILTFVLCLGLPVVSATGWFRTAVEQALLPTRQVSRSASESIVTTADRMRAAGGTGRSPFVFLNAANLLLALWAAWILARSFQIAWTYRRIRRIVAAARPARQSTLPCKFLPREHRRAVEVLVSGEIGMPATAGTRRSVVLLPTVIARSADPGDLDAVLAHEAAHITRHDFLCNLILESLAIPMSYNPAMRALLERIAATRELICDRMAAEQTGNTARYAESLVRIAEMLIQPITSAGPALGLFNGQELEVRVMTLLQQVPRRNRRATALAGLLSLSIFAPCCVAAAGISFEPAALVAVDLQPYAGTWHWMFQGKPFVTMQLVPAGDHFTGYMTNGFFNYDADGNMTDAGSHPGRSAIVRTYFAGKVLHIVVQDDQDKSLSEWTMNLVDSKTAQFNTAAPEAPKNFKPWTAERTSD